MAIAYPLDGVLYLAVTRRCTLRCTFCPKTHGRWTVNGNDMRDDPEPNADQLIEAAKQLGLERYPHVAFVGLGESTFRLNVVTEAGRRLRRKGHHVRMVTDGLGSLRAGRDITSELTGALDVVSVSLNAPDARTYAELCPNPYGEEAHAAACEFIRAARHSVPEVIASVVAVPGLDLKACERLASELGVPLRVRPYFDPLVGEPHGGGATPPGSGR